MNLSAKIENDDDDLRVADAIHDSDKVNNIVVCDDNENRDDGSHGIGIMDCGDGNDNDFVCWFSFPHPTRHGIFRS